MAGGDPSFEAFELAFNCKLRVGDAGAAFWTKGQHMTKDLYGKAYRKSISPSRRDGKRIIIFVIRSGVHSIFQLYTRLQSLLLGRSIAPERDGVEFWNGSTKHIVVLIRVQLINFVLVVLASDLNCRFAAD